MRSSILIPLLASAALVVAPLTVVADSAAAASSPDYGVIWTVDSAANALSEYAPGVSGTATPIATISGPDTGLDDPTGVALGSSGTVYVSNAGNDSITKYAADADGDAAPAATISGSSTSMDEPQGITISGGYVWVVDPPANLVEAFNLGSDGNVLPALTISGSKTDLDHPVALAVDLDLGEIVVANTPSSGSATITAYMRGKFGNVAADVDATGTSKHPITAPTALHMDGEGGFWVTDGATNSISDEFALPGLGGGLLPGHTIMGADTGLNAPSGIAIDALGEPVVTNAGNQSIQVFAADAKADAAPVRTVTGVGSASGAPNAAAIFGAAPSAPTNLAVTVHKDVAHLTWDPPAQTGGGVIAYEVIYGAVSRESFDGGILEGIDFSGFGETTKTSFDTKKLKPGHTYRFLVAAVNAFGGAAKGISATLVAPPSAPRHVSASSGRHSISVHWTEPAKDGGQRITGYRIEYTTCSFAAKGCSFKTRPVGAHRDFVRIRGLTPDTRYHVRVAAKNKTKLGSPSRVVTATPLA